MGNENLNKFIEPVKRVKSEFLPLLVLSIADGLTLTQICRKYGKSKQALNHHIAKLRHSKVIERIQSYPYAIYRLTPLGERVKRFVVQSDDPSKKPRLFKAHNLILGYSVLDYGSYSFEGKKLSAMNGWSFVADEYDTGKAKWKIHIQDTGLIKVYCPIAVTTTPDEAFGDMRSQAERIMQVYCDRYGMRLGQTRTIRLGQKSLYGSQEIAKLVGRVKTDSFWIDASDGTDELEEKEGVHAIEDFLDAPKELAKQVEILGKRLEDYAHENVGYAREIAAHREVIANMNAGVQNLNVGVSVMSEAIEKMNGILDKLSESINMANRKNNRQNE